MIKELVRGRQSKLFQTSWLLGVLMGSELIAAIESFIIPPYSASNSTKQLPSASTQSTVTTHATSSSTEPTKCPNSSEPVSGWPSALASFPSLTCACCSTPYRGTQTIC